MADPITREQVERAIKAAEHGYMDPWISYFGADWRGVVPRYVLAAYGDDSGGWETAAAALTRWHAELVVAETSRKVARWDGESHWELSPAHTLSNMTVVTACDRAQAIAWGYTIEGDPEPIQALSRCPDCGGPRTDMDEHDAWCDGCWEKRCDAHAAAPDHLAYADSPVWDDGPLPTPTPERPAPRFKVGDWARDRDTVFRVAEMHWDDDRWYARPVAGVRDGIAEYSLQPASPPAPEVVDVPQPIVKRCSCPDIHDDVEATWQSGEPYLTVTHTTVPLALLRAMLEAIDAQQGGAS